MQRGFAEHEEADARFHRGDVDALDDRMTAQRVIAEMRVPLEQSRTEDRLAWIEWAHGLAATTNELLCEIRDLLTKMANPPIMVSLESTPESRAASREAEREAAEPASHIGKVVQQITESTKKVYETYQEAAPVNDGSEAADERDRALGRAVKEAGPDKEETAYLMVPILNTPYRSWSVMKDGFQWGVARITTGGALEIRIDSTQYEAFIQQLERAP